MRTLLSIVAVVVLVVAGLLYTGMIRLPVEQAGSISVTAPRVGIETGRVAVGTEQRTVTTPTLRVEKAGEAPQNAQ